MKRGSGGLGFSVVGGKGSPNGDLPICIKSVSKDSVAAREGRLKQGDILLAVNDISFEHITQQVAVETLKCLRGDIVLTICSI